MGLIKNHPTLRNLQIVNNIVIILDGNQEHVAHVHLYSLEHALHWASSRIAYAQEFTELFIT